MSEMPLIIAEAGVNHNGDVRRAIAMVEVAAAAGADVIKFQAFSAAELVAAGTATADYQKTNSGLTDQAEMLAQLALELENFADIAKACELNGIEFLCTVFDTGMTRALIDLGMRRIKVASGELTNTPALRQFSKFGLPILLSTGMASLAEVEAAVSVIRDGGNADITLLHCTSLYPTPDESVNLRAMQTMRDHFGLPVGYSDHSAGDHVAIAATALGARVIEKHFTLDRNLPGPDHAASIEPQSLSELVRKIRGTAFAMGDGIKRAQATEHDTAHLVRRSWRAARALAAGRFISADDVVLKRPADGLSPDCSPVGRRLRHALAEDQAVRAEDLA
ncbi:MAG: N,N'-diacetyllegionaminic acid synthase [Pseudorhodoplanes sp.]|nr:N,N'-diacetyllegionaminic acid synthase [Pseudorhodoplanes sp.]